MGAMDDYQQWEESLLTTELPRWDQLPKFDLYMDQVVAFINTTLGKLEFEPVTASMINNYVKHKVVLAPVKKKYQSMQIADILVISLLKQNYSLDVIHSGINQVTKRNYPKQAYDHFIEMLEAGIREQQRPEMVGADQLNEKLLEVAVESIITELKAKKLLKLMEREKA